MAKITAEISAWLKGLSAVIGPIFGVKISPPNHTEASDGQMVDGVQLVAGDRISLDLRDPKCRDQIGFYTTSAGSWGDEGSGPKN